MRQKNPQNDDAPSADWDDKMKKEPDDKLPPEYLELLNKLKNVMIWAVILFISMLILLIIVSQSVVLIISSAHDIILYTTVDLSIFVIILSVLLYWIHHTLLGERYKHTT